MSAMALYFTISAEDSNKTRSLRKLLAGEQEITNAVTMITAENSRIVAISKNTISNLPVIPAPRDHIYIVLLIVTQGFGQF